MFSRCVSQLVKNMILQKAGVVPCTESSKTTFDSVGTNSKPSSAAFLQGKYVCFCSRPWWLLVQSMLGNCSDTGIFPKSDLVTCFLSLEQWSIAFTCVTEWWSMSLLRHRMHHGKKSETQLQNRSFFPCKHFSIAAFQNLQVSPQRQLTTFCIVQCNIM